MDKDRDPQKEIQRIYEEKIFPQIQNQAGVDPVSISLTQEESKDICDFFGLFAY